MVLNVILHIVNIIRSRGGNHIKEPVVEVLVVEVVLVEVVLVEVVLVEVVIFPPTKQFSSKESN